MSLFKIADQADADCCQVDPVVFDVAAEQLLVPARADFDFAVAGVDPVTDQKVVGQPILHAAAPVGGIIFRSVPVFDTAVVDDDALPIIGADIDTGRHCPGTGDVIAVPMVAGSDRQLLANADDIASQCIIAFDLCDRDPIPNGNATQGIAGADYVIVCGRLIV